MLEFVQVHKSYGKRPVISIPGLQLPQAIYWLQGPNGAGKTTLLRMVAGLLPFKGDIRIDGYSQLHQPVHYRRTISWGDAEPLYPGFLTGEDLLTFYCGILKPPSGQAEDLLELFGIRSYLLSPLGTWSDGMIKKLSLLLAFLGQPSWVVLDEPLITLDQQMVPGLVALIGERHRQKGTGFLISSHQALTLYGMPITPSLRVADQSMALIT